MTVKQESQAISQSPFPNAVSKILPDPSKFYSPNLHSLPFPTHSFFKNFVLGNGDQPVFQHPYMFKISSSGIAFCYPSVNTTQSSVSQNFSDDFSISSLHSYRHLVSSYSDLSVTVDFKASDIRLFLARGCPYITLQLSRALCLRFSCKSDIKSISSSSSNTKHKIELENKQCWIVYSSSELILKKQDNHKFNARLFAGIIRVAVMPNSNAKTEEILDLYKGFYPIKGEADFTNPFSLDYKWETEGWGELLMLAHPLHVKLISSLYNSDIRVLNKLKYKSIDEELVGVVGNSWSLRAPHVPITWHSFRGIAKTFHPEIVASLWKDVGELDSSVISTTHVLLYGNKIFKAARLALIAEEVNCSDVIPAIRKFLRDTITPWLNSKFEGNGFVYESIWGGIVSKQGLIDKKADYGFGLFDKLHYLGYFVYAIAVLARLDPDWGIKFRNEAYALVCSWMNLSRSDKSKYPRLRHFDLYKLHSWKGAATGECDSHHSSEHVFTYYAASLLGMVYGDQHLMGMGSTLASFEIEATKTWFHVMEGEVYGDKFNMENKLVGISTRSKREDKLFFAPAAHKEIRVGMHVLPLLPITEILFSDVGFVRDVVEWATPALARAGVSAEWVGFVHALETLYDKDSALKKIKRLKGFNEAHCLTSFLWWAHSRAERENFCCHVRKMKANAGFALTVVNQTCSAPTEDTNAMKICNRLTVGF